MSNIGHNSAAFAEQLLQEPGALFSEPETNLPALLAHLENEVLAHTPDVTTSKGRAAITKLASRMVSAKTSLDAFGKTLNEDARKQIDRVDVVRRQLRDGLDKLRDQARKPLSDWEAEEKAREQQILDVRKAIFEAGRVTITDTSASLQARIEKLYQMVIPDCGDLTETVQHDKHTALDGLRTAAERAKRDEHDRAELAELRAKRDAEAREAERLQQEEKRRAALEEATRRAAEKAAADAVEAERKRAQAVIDELERERARMSAEADRQRRQAAEEEAERRRVQMEREAAEKARALDLAHRQSVLAEVCDGVAKALDKNAAESIVAQKLATLIVNAIVAGEVPHVSIKF